MKSAFMSLAFIFVLAIAAKAENLVEHLQNISVTVKAGSSQGSGVLFTRKVDNDDVTFVWTAAHVVDSLRHTRDVVDSKTGSKKTVIEFKDASIVQEFKQDGRRIGEIKMDAKVVRYSDPDSGEDLALLQIRKKNFTNYTVKFYLDENIPSIGTPLYHVGSLLGQIGANSLTDGIISQIGRVVEIGNGTLFDQTTATAFPGSSGGGVFLKSDGRYVGMIVRGAGEGFNLIVPIRRMQRWAKEANVEWAIDPSLPYPSEEDLRKLPIEDSGNLFGQKSVENKVSYPTYIYVEE